MEGSQWHSIRGLVVLLRESSLDDDPRLRNSRFCRWIAASAAGIAAIRSAVAASPTAIHAWIILSLVGWFVLDLWTTLSSEYGG